MTTYSFSSSIRSPGAVRFSFVASSVTLFAAMLALAGCSVFPKPQTDPTRYYVLNGPAAATPSVVPSGGLRVGLHTVRSASYLDGKAMIVRRGDNEIDHRDFARWAEPLSTGVGRMLNAQLLASGKVARVFQQPFPLDAERDIDLSVSILRCEGLVKADGMATASFVCALEITDAGANGAVRMRRVFSAPETTWKEGDYAALAAQLSESVSQLAAAVLADLPER